MSEQDNDELESKNQPSEEDVKTDVVEDDDAQSDSEDLEAIKEKNKRLFERAKKAEAEAKLLKAERLKKEEQAKVAEAPKAPAVSEKQDAFDLEDVAALVQAVPDKEDRALVKKWAKFEKTSLEQALANPVIKQMLKDSAEKRATASATNTSAARRGSSKPSPEVILDNAAKGVLPDDIEDLVDARFEARKRN